jgi:hypothetical protein
MPIQKAPEMTTMDQSGGSGPSGEIVRQDESWTKNQAIDTLPMPSCLTSLYSILSRFP